MGIIGNLIYRDNPALAAQVDQQLQTLTELHQLHDAMVTSYRELAEEIRTFDSHLVALLVLQYHATFPSEELGKLPPTSLPLVETSLAQRIEELDLTAVGLTLAVSGIRAIGGRVANLLSEGGAYRTAAAGGEGEGAIAGGFAEEVTPELVATAGESSLVQTATVEVLTQTAVDAEVLGGAASQVGVAAEVLGTVAGADGAAPELGELADAAGESTEAAGEAAAAADSADAAAAAGELGLEAGAEAAAAGGIGILGPAAILIFVVTEVIGIFEAEETHERLLAAVAHLGRLHDASVASLGTVRKAYRALLAAGRLDLQAYDRLLRRLRQLEGGTVFDGDFPSDAFDTFRAALPDIGVGDVSKLHAGRSSCTIQLAAPLAKIRDQAEHDSIMVAVISEIRTHITGHGRASITPNFLAEIAEINGITAERAEAFDRFRIVLDEIGSMLGPFHDAIHHATPAGDRVPTVPPDAPVGSPDATRQPDPARFHVP